MKPLSMFGTSLVGALALACLTLAPAAGQGLNLNEPEPIDEPMPMEIGTEWTYAGTVWWTPRRGREVYVEHVKWTMRVVDAYEHEALRVAVLEGHPFDLIWYESGRQPGDYLLVETAEGEYYLLRGGAADAVTEYFESDGDVEAVATGEVADGEAATKEKAEEEAEEEPDLPTLLARGDLLLDLPLSIGKRYCPERPEDDEPGDCWSVIGELPTALPGVRGVRAADDTQGYILTMRTRERHAISNFVPGVGFTSFSAGHAGTAPSAVELRLIKVAYGDAEPQEDPTQDTTASR